MADVGGFSVGSRLLGMVMGSELVQSVPSTSPHMCGMVYATMSYNITHKTLKLSVTKRFLARKWLHMANFGYLRALEASRGLFM